MKKWLKRIFPAPLMSLVLIGMWLLLVQSIELGSLVFATLCGFIIPIFSANLRPRYVRVRRPLAIIKLFCVVTVDAWWSAWQVMRILLKPVPEKDTSEFVRVPLEMRDPNGLAILAIISCITPGNAWSELSMDRSMLLLHVLDSRVDPNQVIQTFKQKYERPLMEIFEK